MGERYVDVGKVRSRSRVRPRASHGPPVSGGLGEPPGARLRRRRVNRPACALRTDLGAEVNRSRHGTRPISAKGDGATGDSRRPPRAQHQAGQEGPGAYRWGRGTRATTTALTRRQVSYSGARPGAQLRFDDVEGYRLTAFATSTRVGQLADLEVRHRPRARCEDRIRCAKDTGPGVSRF
mgnify:FL=1